MRGRSRCQRPHGDRRLQGHRQESVLGQSPAGRELKSAPGVHLSRGYRPNFTDKACGDSPRCEGKGTARDPVGVSLFPGSSRQREPSPRAESPKSRSSGRARGSGEDCHRRSQAWPGSCPAARAQRPRDQVRPRHGDRASHRRVWPADPAASPGDEREPPVPLTQAPPYSWGAHGAPGARRVGCCPGPAPCVAARPACACARGAQKSPGAGRLAGNFQNHNCLGVCCVYGPGSEYTFSLL